MYICVCFFSYLMRKLLMSAMLGTMGLTQVTCIVSGPTWAKPKSVGAGTAIEKRAALFRVCSKGTSGVQVKKGVREFRWFCERVNYGRK